MQTSTPLTSSDQEQSRRHQQENHTMLNIINDSDKKITESVSCRDCLFYQQVSADSGFCTFNPPVPLVVGGKVISAIPETIDSAFCSKFYPVGGETL